MLTDRHGPDSGQDALVHGAATEHAIRVQHHQLGPCDHIQTEVSSMPIPSESMANHCLPPLRAKGTADTMISLPHACRLHACLLLSRLNNFVSSQYPGYHRVALCPLTHRLIAMESHSSVSMPAPCTALVLP